MYRQIVTFLGNLTSFVTSFSPIVFSSTQVHWRIRLFLNAIFRLGFVTVFYQHGASYSQPWRMHPREVVVPGSPTSSDTESTGA